MKEAFRGRRGAAPGRHEEGPCDRDEAPGLADHQVTLRHPDGARRHLRGAGGPRNLDHRVRHDLQSLGAGVHRPWWRRGGPTSDTPVPSPRLRAPDQVERNSATGQPVVQIISSDIDLPRSSPRSSVSPPPRRSRRARRRPRSPIGFWARAAPSTFQDRPLFDREAEVYAAPHSTSGATGSRRRGPRPSGTEATCDTAPEGPIDAGDPIQVIAVAEATRSSSSWAWEPQSWR